MRRPETISDTEDNDNPYWMSFSDLLSGLLVLFILATMVLLIQLLQAQEVVVQRTTEMNQGLADLEQKSQKLETLRKEIEQTTQQLINAEEVITQTRKKLDSVELEILKAIQELGQAELVRRELLQELKNDLNALGIQVEVADNESILRIPTTVLAFESNQYEIPLQDQAVNTVGKIGEILYRRLIQGSRFEQLDTVFVEGHTDSRKSAREKGNGGLSTFRAISVWQWWQDSSGPAGQLQHMKNHSGKPLFSVSGYAATRRIQEDESTPAQLEQNRRIDIRFTSRNPAMESYQAIHKLLQGYSQ